MIRYPSIYCVFGTGELWDGSRFPISGSDMSTSNSLAGLLALQDGQAAKYYYSNVSSAIVLIYDWLLTIDSELAFVWNPRWNLGTLLYLLTRYSAFINAAVYLYGTVGYSIPPSVCGVFVSMSAWVLLFVTVVSEVIMVLCAWAMWGGGRRMAIGLTILTLVTTAIAIVGLCQYRSSTTYTSPDGMLPNFPGCQNITHGVGAHDTPFLDFLVLAFVEIVLFALMLFKAVKHSRYHSSTFVLECFRHGLLYYAVLGVLSITNLALTAQRSSPRSLLIFAQGAFHTILSTRMMLHLRRLAHQPRCEDTTTRGVSLGSGIIFQSRSRGSIGNASDGRMSII
ncbi:hypothetical protein BD779DRAFT_106140 [Infundibulicybe gibba]|nr:hypothetical protein BD779DRAFT_106140 [Infundibulicybe gibba]